ncbi:MAG: hypothetical protein M1833_003839 [Piccolia ochrophora]|nr:MAG: hypothetical protein M1833_003839 [Piccolia ochrophora]
MYKLFTSILTPRQCRPSGSQWVRRCRFSSYVVTPDDLASAISQNAPSKISTSPKTVPLCATWFLPNEPNQRTGLSAFKERRIPDARFFDLDAVKDKTSPYPHMLPTPQDFAQAMQELGINRDDTVVVYDSAELGIFSAPRVGWTLKKVFGHDKVHLLNNFRLWVEQGHPIESGDTIPVQRSGYPVPEINSKVSSFERVRDVARDVGKEGSEGVQVLDARSGGRWAGTEPEPRPGLSSGHIPGSFSVPISELLDPTSKALLSAPELRDLFNRKGVDPERPIISSCGTGVTAAVIDVALDEAGYSDAQRTLYDGSWTEWAQRVTEADGLIRKKI